jgi:hypothetical protein
MKSFYYSIILFVSIVSLNSCTPKISSNIQTRYNPLPENQEILVIPTKKNKPNDVELLGTGSIDAYEYMIECAYDDIINQAKEKARGIGGNCINITWHLAPSNSTNTCHQIKFEILRLNDRQLQDYAKNSSLKEIDPIAIPDAMVKEQKTTSSSTLINTTPTESDIVSPNFTLNSGIEKKNQKKKTIDRNYNKYKL